MLSASISTSGGSCKQLELGFLVSKTGCYSPAYVTGRWQAVSKAEGMEAPVSMNACTCWWTSVLLMTLLLHCAELQSVARTEVAFPRALLWVPLHPALGHHVCSVMIQCHSLFS